MCSIYTPMVITEFTTGYRRTTESSEANEYPPSRSPASISTKTIELPLWKVMACLSFKESRKYAVSDRLTNGKRLGYFPYQFGSFSFHKHFISF